MDQPLTHLYNLFTERSAVFEVDLVAGADLQVVVTLAAFLHVQLEVEQSDRDALSLLNAELPVTVGVHEVFGRIVWTGHKPVVVEVWPVRTKAGMLDGGNWKEKTRHC